jgi:hypothetical protein
VWGARPLRERLIVFAALTFKLALILLLFR